MDFIDIFCGAGFGARGAVKGGGNPVLGVDFWELATKTYQANFPRSDVLNKSVEDIDPGSLSSSYSPDILLTSPECTSHSIARGAKPGSEKSRETAMGIVPWVEAFNPRWLIVENVNRMKTWDRHNELVETIESYGYTVNDLYLNAADFGTAQSRKRMFLICDKEGSIISKENLANSHKKQFKDAYSIIDWNDKYKSTPLYKEGRAEATIDRAKRAIKKIGKNKPFLIVYYGSDYAGGWQRLDNPLRTVTTLDRFGLVTWKKKEPYLRMLQPDELLNAMGTGSEHKLPFGSRREKIKLCGNGVCSPVLEVIFRKIKKIQESETLLKAS